MSDHPSADSLAMHALDSLEPEVGREVDAHLRQCAACRAELDVLRESASLLAESVPALSPPAALRARVLERATSDRALTDRALTDRAKGDRSQLGAVRAPARKWSTRMWPLLAAASLLVTLVTGAALQRATAERRELRTELARAQSIAAERAAQGARRDSLLARVLAADVEVVTLASTETAPTMRLYRDRTRGELILAAHRLPPAPTGQTYQLWGIGQSGVPMGLGTFNTAADGSVVLVLNVASDVQFDVSAVTQEPEGGSPAPTSTPFLVGRWGD